MLARSGTRSSLIDTPAIADTRPRGRVETTKGADRVPSRATACTKGCNRDDSEPEAKDQFLDQTLQVWQPRAARELTHEDARQIIANFTGFFRVLAEWKAAELREKEKDLSSCPREVSS